MTIDDEDAAAAEIAFPEGARVGREEIAAAVREYFARPCHNTLTRLQNLAKEEAK